MKKMIRLVGMILLLFLMSGCNHQPVRTDPKLAPPSFFQHLSKGESAEARKDLAQALDHYKQALIAAPRKSDQQVKAHQMVLRVERKINEAKRYCQEYKTLIQAGKHSEAKSALKQVHRLWPFYTECNLSPEPAPSPTPQSVGPYRILEEKPVIHKIRHGEIISKLCQKYYGQTKDYQLVNIITHYNKINANALVSGQKIKFPSIQLNRSIYRPERSRSQPILIPTIPKSKPTPAPIIPKPKTTPEPIPAPIQPAITPTPTPASVIYFNQAIELFRKERYTDAISTLNNALSTSTDKKDSLRLLAQCHFRLAQISMTKAHYRKARDTFNKALETCQGLQIADLPFECGQIEGLVKKCDAQIKTKAIAVHLDKAKQLFSANKIDPAIAEFEKVLALEPRHGDTLEYLYLAHLRKAARLRKDKAYRKALEEFMTAWEYNQNCTECQLSINQIKGILYMKSKALENELLESSAPVIQIFQKQIEYYTIINQVDPSYKNVAKLLKTVQKRLETVLKTRSEQAESSKN